MSLEQQIFGDKGWRPAVRRYLVFAFPWTISTVAVVVLLMDPLNHFLSSFLVSLFIGEVCMFCSYWGAFVMAFVERWYFRRRGWAPVERTGVVNAVRGTIFMLPALALSFHIVGMMAPYFHLRWKGPEFADYRYGILFGFFSMLVYIARDLYRGKKEADQNISELESRNLKAQVAALTSQMNPHLLFNTLNSIASMIPDSPEAAEAMTLELSKLYRRVLQAARQDQHSLAAEFDLCTSYLEIERGRFGERLRFSVDVAPGVEAARLQIPVLCVQPFVENAVKHGLLHKIEGGSLRLGARLAGASLVITVEDDGVGLGAAAPSKGSGTAINNCRERLSMLYGAEASLELAAAHPGTCVTLTIPASTGETK